MILNSPYISGSLTVTGTTVLSGSVTLASGASIAGTSSLAATASSVSNLSQNVQITGSLGVTSTITAQTLNVQTVTSSIVYSSGSNIFGNSTSNVQQFTGSMSVSGSTAYFAGNVGIGTTSPNASGQGSGINVLTVKGSTSWGGVEVQNNANVANGLLLGFYGFTNSGITGNSAAGMPAYIGSWLSGTTGADNGAEIRFFTKGDAGQTLQRMVISNTGSVGIGTTSPSTLLHVNTTRTNGSNANVITLSDNITGAQTPGYGAIIQYLSNGTGVKAAIGLQNGGTGTNNESQISFYTQNAANSLGQNMILTSAGNLQLGTVSSGGVGTSTPININMGSTFGTNAIGTNFKLKLYEDNVPNPFGLGVSNALLEVIAGTSGAIGFFTNGSERMRILSGGNVGIGTNNPTSPLTVRSTSRSDTLRLSISGSSSVNDAVGITFGSATYDKAQIIAYNENTGNAAGFLTFWTGGSPATTDVTERMRITSGGAVYIGATGMANSQKFGVIGNGVWDGAAIGMQNTGTNGQTYTMFSTNSSFSQGAGNFLLYNVNGAVNSLIVYANGNYAFAGSNVSDRRLKQDIKDLNFGLNEIMQLSPKSYHLKSENNLSGESAVNLKKNYGFIAQEIQSVLPEIVTGQETETEYLGLDYNSVLAVAVKAIQEQQTLIESLKARIEVLESK